tara:strand:- start:222 stop:755 length:534 start_codon:yes stop_codon:yes gene_type:complete
MEFNYELKIPKDRIAVLIGKSGEIKKQIEEYTKTSIDIDSSEGDVVISGEDALGLFTSREVVTAIARGFNPDLAKLLLKGDYSLEVLYIKDYSGDSKKKGLRLKGRVIGQEGKARRTIEELTETYISVYGKTISIIGDPKNVANARKAIESLLSGSPHSHIYKWLEKKKREVKRFID